MNQTERRATFSLAAIFAFRMLGLFMILPIFALYAHHYTGATATLIGVALGIYGLTQACLQIPFGMLSDRVGRKPMITIGLLLFAVGSIVAAGAHSINGIIIGRALQGSGAVGSVIIALVADLTREQNRTKAMAVIGITIGLSFTLAMILGPIFSNLVGLSGIFWLITGLAIIGIIILHMAVPTPTHSVFHRDAEPVPALFKSLLTNRELLRLDAGIMILHAILTASFIAIPIALTKIAGLTPQHQWLVYLPVLLLSFVAMVPFIIIAEKKRQMKAVFLGGIIAIAVTQLLMLNSHTSIFMISISLFIFMTAFTLLEASLPSMISKLAPAGAKGTAMGIYSSSQFLGIFIGGTLGGWLYGHFQLSGIFVGCAALAVIWFIIAVGMKKPPHLGTYLLNVGSINTKQIDSLTKKLKEMTGVADAIIIAEEGVAHLKVDNALVDKQALQQLITEASSKTR